MSTRTAVQNLGPVVNPAHAGKTEAQALHRLARQAHEKGVELIVDEDNRHWASSASRPGHRHVVTLYTCDCVGFARHGRCMHLALVLEAHHALPPLDPTPDGGAVPMPTPVAPDAVAALAYLDSPRGRDERARLLASLTAPAFDRACGMTGHALAAHCEALAGEPSPYLVCPSRLCAGVGVLDGRACDICGGRGAIPSRSAAVDVLVAAYVGEAGVAAA